MMKTLNDVGIFLVMLLLCLFALFVDVWMPVKELTLTVGYMKRGGFGADKLSIRTKVIGSRHFHKLKTSHDLYTLLAVALDDFY